MRRSIFRPILLGASFAVPLLLAGCGGDEGVPQSFPPLRYNYLAPISLNVGNIQTDVRYVSTPGGSNLDATSPEAPLQAVQQMIQDRLVAGGAGGAAVITINAASLNQVNDTVVGNISLRLTVSSADGRQHGYTDASVTRTRTMPDNTGQDALRAFLYSMTQELVSAENVELEYQIRQNLPGWLIGGGSAVIGGPAAPTPVQAVPLGGPGSSVPMTGGMAPMVTPMSPMPGVSNTTTGSVPQNTDTMPGGSLGIPEGNPVPTGQDFSAPATTSTVPGAPVPLTPAVPATPPGAGTGVGTSGNTTYQLVPSQPSGATAPTPAAPATTTTTTTTTKPAAAPSSSGTGALPPLPAGITP